jgi:hypothetical protein
MPAPPPDPINSAARLLLTHSDRGWERLLAEHVNDGTDHCRACHGPRWPCSLWAIAHRAHQLARSS